MKKNRYILYITSLFTFVGLLFTSCEDVQEEIKELNLSRYLKVQDLQANAIGGTQIRLNWEQNTIADSYVVEIFVDDKEMKFEGDPTLTLENITNDDLPYVQTGLESTTTYAIRVKAVGQKADDSLWSDGVTVTTPGEQLFNSVDVITYESAIVYWVANETVTHLLVSGGDLNNKQFDLNQANIENGEYEITGLSAETTYTVRLMNGTKERGNISFTTGINPGDAILVTEDDDLQAMIEAADAGSRFYLSGDEYDYGTIQVTKSFTLVSNGNTVLSAKFNFINGSALTLQSLILDGKGTLDAPFIYETAGNFGALTVLDCTIRNYSGRLISATASAAPIVSSAQFDKCIIYNITGGGTDFIDFRNAKLAELIITNSTIYNSYTSNENRDFIRLDQAGTDINKTVIIDHCTLYNFNINGKRIFYVRSATGFTNSNSFTNNIVYNTNSVFRDQGATVITTLSGNNYYNANNLISGSANNNTYDTNGTTYDPQFADPDNGDFTVTNNDLKYSNVGDPRWLP